MITCPQEVMRRAPGQMLPWVSSSMSSRQKLKRKHCTNLHQSPNPITSFRLEGVDLMKDNYVENLVWTLRLRGLNWQTMQPGTRCRVRWTFICAEGVS